MTPIAPSTFNSLVANPTYKTFCKEFLDLLQGFNLIADWYAWLFTENTLDGTLQFSAAFNSMVCDVLATCALTTTTTSSTSTTSTSTTAVTGSTSTTTTVSTSTTTSTTTSGTVFVGTITPDIHSPTRTSFGLFLAPGNYRVNYISGALQYSGYCTIIERFNLNASPSYGYRIFYNDGANVVEGPGAGDYPVGSNYVSQAACEAHYAGAHVDFVHTGGEIAMYLQDAPYNDNCSPGTRPTFSLYRVIP